MIQIFIDISIMYFNSIQEAIRIVLTLFYNTPRVTHTGNDSFSS